MKKTIAFVLLITLLFIQGCSTDFIDDFSLRIKPEIIDYSAQLEIIDEENPNSSLPNLTLSIVSRNSNDVFEISGAQSFQLVDGRIGIGLHPRANPDPSNPVTVRMKIQADGYLDKIFEVVFSTDEKTQYVQIPMVNIANPPTGVQFNLGSASLMSGALSQPYTMNLNPANGSTTGMSLTMPTGTQFFDRMGNPISGSQVDIQVGYFDADNESSMDAFPGGFSADSISQSNGTGASGSFITAGFTTMNMEINGQEVKSFNQPITVSMDISSNTVNPNTGMQVQLGDVIPVWSYDETVGSWGFETDGTVTQGANGLQVSYQTTHLSWWNLDFYGQRCCGSTWNRVNGSWVYQYLGPCANVTFSIPGWNVNDKGMFRVKVVYAGTNQVISYYADKIYELYNGKTISYLGVPNFNVEIKVYRLSTGDLVGSSAITTLCTGNIPLNLNLPQPTTITFRVEGYCKDNNLIRINPSFWVYYRETDLLSNRWYQTLGYVSGGFGTTSSVEVGKTYDFRAYFNGRTIDTTATIDRLNYNIQLELGDFCNDF